MTRLSATATIAALLLLAIAQGFGATKVSAKIAAKSTAKPYHITAQNQFHIKQPTKNMAKAPALARALSKDQQHAAAVAQRHANGPLAKRNALAEAGRLAAQRTPAPKAARRNVRHNQANPPTGKVGFVSATQVQLGGENNSEVQVASFGTSTAFITVVDNGTADVYQEVESNGDGTFTVLPAAPATATPTVCDCFEPTFVVGDVNGDGYADIVEYDGGSTFNVLLSNQDGTFTATAQSPLTLTLPAGATSLTGGTGVLDATSGFIDLVVVDNNEPSDIVTYAGNGDGTFVTTAATTATLAPAGLEEGIGFYVMIADFDGDGKVDVAEFDDNDGALNVYLAANSFAGTTTVTPDGNYDECSSTFGSLTGSSGLPAIVTTNCSFETITVYNNSAGAFSEGVYYPVAISPSATVDVYPEAATIGDVNGDGNGDIVVTNDDSSDVIVMLGNGDGTLQVASGGSVGYAVGGYPFGASVVMDVNGDGLADILLADDNQSLVWMAGYGDGTFQAARNFYAPIPFNNGYAYGISEATGDFNGDGFADVVVTNYADGNGAYGVTVFLSNPDGSLQPGVNYGSIAEADFVAVADFNGDGNLDFAVTDYEGGVWTFTGTGTGTFIQGPVYNAGGELEGIISGQFNEATAAGFNDLAVVSYGSGVTILLNDGTGGFTANATYGLTSGACLIADGTLNTPTDSHLDLAVSECGGSQVGILMGDGTGVFTAALDVPVGGNPYGIALGDVNGDGILDLVTSSGSQSIALALGTGGGAFGTATTMPSSTIPATSGAFYEPYPAEVRLTDVDGDGNPDVVYTNSNYSTVGILFGTGTGTATTPYFFDPVEFPAGQYAYGVAVADLNGDGAPDAAVAPDDFAGATTLINANGTAAAPNYSLTANTSFLNVADGGSGTVTITLTPVNFYSGTVTFSCGNLPLGVTCAFSPATLTPLGNAPLQTTLTVTTLAPSSSLRMPADANPHQGRTSLLACLTGMGLFGMLLAGDWKNKRNRRIGILLGILVLGMMFSLVGCSSSSKPGTPIGAQQISVTGTGSDGTTNNVSITLNVF